MVSIIDNAKSYVYVEVYMFTEKRIRESLINAKNRGLDIKVIIEKNPYLASNINNNTFEELIKNNINVVWSNIENYTLNHSKMILIDGFSIISTGNLTYSSFTQNRDIFLFIKDEKLHEQFLEIFDYDFNGIKKGVVYENIVLSPINSRDKILKLFEKAQNEIKIHIPYFSDDEIVNKLIELKKEKNIEISAIIPKTATDDENTKKLVLNGIKIYKIPKYNLHSKAILIDNEYLFVGSVNFSSYSLDKNREIGVITKEKNAIIQFNQIFELDIIK